MKNPNQPLEPPSPGKRTKMMKSDNMIFGRESVRSSPNITKRLKRIEDERDGVEEIDEEREDMR
jgi:CRP-like cAMP-binding protein